MRRPLRIGLIGSGKMGRIHSHAYLSVGRIFDHQVQPVLSVAGGRDGERTAAFAERFGWAAVETDWRRLVDRDDVDLVDICTPNHLHAEIARAAIAAGKHVVCEKPLAIDLAAAEELAQLAAGAGVVAAVVFNYRFLPAVQLAQQLIEAGELGEIYQYLGSFQQDWLADRQAPTSWRLDPDLAGSGVLADLGAHLIDLAHTLVGPIRSVLGALHTSVDQRPDPTGSLVPVLADDSFEALIDCDGGASGILSASRVATGQKTRNRFEIYGSGGALQFDFGAMNELRFFSTDDPLATRGFRTISTLHPEAHSRMGQGWGQGHHIGFDHTFIHFFDEVLSAIEQQRQVVPGFAEGLACQRVIDGVLRSAEIGGRVQL